MGITFWWYSFRPSRIVRSCSLEAKQKAVTKLAGVEEDKGKFRSDDRDSYYKWCLQEHGLVK